MHAFFADALAEMAKIRWLAGQLPLEGLHAAEGLEIWILPPFLHNALVTQIGQLLEQKQSCHETDGFCRSAAFGIEWREFSLKFLPRDFGSQEQERILWIELVDQIGIEKTGLGMFGGCLCSHVKIRSKLNRKMGHTAAICV